MTIIAHFTPQEREMELDLIGKDNLLSSFKSLIGKEVPNRAVDFDDPPNTSGGNGYCIMDYWEGYEAMSKTETFDASLGIGIKGVLSLDAGYSDKIASKTTNHSVVLLIDSRADRKFTRVRSVKWRDGVTLPTPGDPSSYRDFYTKYGDRFVSSVTTGARYTLALIYFATTAQEAQEVKTNLGLSASIKGAPVEGAIKDNLAKGMEKINVQCKALYSAVGLGDIEGGMPPSESPPTKLLDFALSIQTKNLPEAAIVDVGLESYNVIPGDTHVFGPVDENLTRFNSVTAKAQQARTLYKRADWLSTVYHYFGNTPDPELDQLRKEVKEDLLALNQVLDTYESNPGDVVTLPELQSIKRDLPELNVQDWESTLYGTDRGEHKHRSMANPDWPKSPWRIGGVRVSRWAEYVGDIEVRYDRLYLTNAGPVIQEIGWSSLRDRGNDDGFFIGPHGTPSNDAYVKALNIRCGEFLDRFAIQFSDNVEANGGGGGMEIHLKEDQNCITGFVTNTDPGMPLYGLKILGKKFLPTHWAPHGST
jgi:hypothetical protein